MNLNMMYSAPPEGKRMPHVGGTTTAAYEEMKERGKFYVLQYHGKSHTSYKYIWTGRLYQQPK